MSQSKTSKALWEKCRERELSALVFHYDSGRPFADIAAPARNVLLRSGSIPLLNRVLCREGELNPHGDFSPKDFKSFASADSAIPAHANYYTYTADYRIT